MCFFNQGKSDYSSASTSASTSEAKNTAEAAKKQRLLETSGGATGQQLSANQGQSVRKVFGN